MKRYLPFLFASILPLSFFSWFAPNPMNQLDFLLLWVLAMVVLALPLIYAEIALASRSGLTPLTGMQKLTREADSSIAWRSFSWLSAIVAIVLAGSLVTTATAGLSPLLADIGVSLPSFAVMVGLIVIALIASVWGLATASVGLVLVVAGLVISLSSRLNGIHEIELQMTGINLSEWGRAVMLALVSVGAGSGLYWFANANVAVSEKAKAGKKISLTKTVLPIWAVQLIVGSFALGLLSMSTLPVADTPVTALSIIDKESILAITLFSLGMVCVASVLLNFVSHLFISQFSHSKDTNMLTKYIPTAKGMLLTLVLAVALVLIPNTMKLIVLVLLSSLSVLMLTIFTGWKMKISHLRKSLNFGSEFTYNIWRIAMRIVVPLGLIVGLIGWLMDWMA